MTEIPPPPGNYPPPPPLQGAASGPTLPQNGTLPTAAYTPWLTRVGAWVIDVLPAVIISGIGQGIAIATGENSCVNDGGDSGYAVACTWSYSTIGILVSGLASILTLSYVIWNYGYKQGTTGSSIGKSVLKFQVISEKTGQPIGFGPSILRQIAHVVDAVICYIGYLFPLRDGKRQTLADKFMTTICLPIT